MGRPNTAALDIVLELTGITLTSFSDKKIAELHGDGVLRRSSDESLSLGRIRHRMW